jgi:streptogrisin C
VIADVPPPAPPPAIVIPAPPAPILLPLTPPPAATADPPAGRLLSTIEALARDAQEYAAANAVGADEAMRRLQAQEESIAVTDRLAIAYRDRLAGIAIEHSPAYRIIVLLTGSEAVPDQSVSAGGLTVPILFRTGAAATRDRLLATITEHRLAILDALPGPAGMGIDPRSGEIVVTVKALTGGSEEALARSAEFSTLTGVPVRVRLLDQTEANLSAVGGSRVEGIDDTTGRRAACTTGFVVTDQARTGILTAAHCPYTLVYRDPAGTIVPLTQAGAWGARYQDVQIQLGPTALSPLFFSDREKSVLRPVTRWRNRASTRAGDVVCHRGERTGYSCAQIELVDYAPPGDLCGGPCDATWVTVAGPSCGAGDSGGPVFAGTTAFGILKGGSYRRDGGCTFYYYMSTDYLPAGWTLLYR